MRGLRPLLNALAAEIAELSMRRRMQVSPEQIRATVMRLHEHHPGKAYEWANDHAASYDMNDWRRRYWTDVADEITPGIGSFHRRRRRNDYWRNRDPNT